MARPSKTRIIAMWSGPRNLSTAMMYSFGARADCAVWDEPFYAPYLKATGIDHPLAAETMAVCESDPDAVGRLCREAPSGGEPLYYQKHHTHHMLASFDLGWMEAAQHVFLIRHPARVIASYAKKRENPTLQDVGGAEQLAIFERASAAMGREPLVVDSADIRDAPEPMLRAICDWLEIDFDAAMLRWPAGGRPEDGPWASHWYGAVHRSTGFAEPEGPLPDLPAELRPLLDAALPPYEALKARALKL